MPLLLYLHGAGERGEDVDKLTFHGPIKVVRKGMALPFMIISPQCANDSTWFDYGERLISLVEEYVKRNDVDANRVYVTGNSMGGFGTWSVATMSCRRRVRHLKRITIVAPPCTQKPTKINAS